MNNYPRFAQVKEKKYKINTDFRIALKCNQIATDGNIADEERALAIIYLLYGDEGLNNSQDWEDLIQIALKFLKCGKQEVNNEEEVDMDFEQDWNYIQTSFFYDYNIDLTQTEIHWWQFYDLMVGLSEKCILNRVRFVRTYDISQIKDSKEKQKWIKQKELVALKKEKSSEEKRLDEIFERQLRKEQ